MRPGLRRIAAVAVLSGATALGAGFAPAAGALTFNRCSPRSDFGCAHVPVPLDRSGGVPGTIDLLVERRPPDAGSPRGAVLVLAGGPGQAATPFADSFAALLGPALRTRE